MAITEYKVYKALPGHHGVSDNNRSFLPVISIDVHPVSALNFNARWHSVRGVWLFKRTV